MIMLDTNVVSEIAHERSHPNVAEWAARQDRFELFLSVPVIAELAFGAQRIFLRNKSPKYLIALDDLITVEFRNRILPNDISSALRYGEIYAKREAAGRPVGPMDAMIAAICIVHDATLATRNVRDFDGLDLRLVNPFETGA
jgi:predicted nucleic acid-binding protein